MNILEYIFDGLKSAGGIWALIINITASCILALISIIIQKLAPIGCYQEKREIHLLNKTFFASIVGTLISIGIIVISMIITALIFKVFPKELSVYELRVMITCISILLEIKLFLWFSHNLKYSPYEFCKYRMVYLWFYISFIVYMITPDHLQTQNIFTFINRILIFLWICPYVLLLSIRFYYLIIFIFYNHSINKQVKNEYLIVFNDEIEYIPNYNLKSVHIIQDFTILKITMKILNKLTSLLEYIKSFLGKSIKEFKPIQKSLIFKFLLRLNIIIIKFINKFLSRLIKLISKLEYTIKIIKSIINEFFNKLITARENKIALIKKILFVKSIISLLKEYISSFINLLKNLILIIKEKILKKFIESNSFNKLTINSVFIIILIYSLIITIILYFILQIIIEVSRFLYALFYILLYIIKKIISLIKKIIYNTLISLIESILNFD